MCRQLFPFAVGILALASACSDPKCPHPYMDYGDQCRFCPPGEERSRGVCVPVLEGGVEGAEAEEAGTESSGPEANVDLDSGDTTEIVEAPDAGTPAENGGLTEVAPPVCYRDADRDGMGAGERVPCGTNGDEGVSTTDRDCDDNDPKRSPSLSDLCGDSIDNDCDGTPDDESNNACGGPCSAQLGHQPGEACDNGLDGACFRSGTYECQGTVATVCSAPAAFPANEVCGDRLDNDCDGTIDEGDAVNATVWYEDCDGDGYSPLTDALIASEVGTRRACAKPPATSRCTGGWTDKRPQMGSTWDCDDTSPVYRPGAPFGVPPAGHTRIDLNCDGIEEKENAVGIPGFLADTYTSVPLCSASLSCQACGSNADGSERLAAQWVDADGQPTETQPRCSRTADDRFGSRETNALFGGFCPGGEWAFGGQGRSIQMCR